MGYMNHLSKFTLDIWPTDGNMWYYVALCGIMFEFDLLSVNDVIIMKLWKCRFL
mgnify:CR=1 FL=1